MAIEMEETPLLRRIHSEGRGLSAGTQEYDMKNRHVLAAAAVLALTAPAYAGHLGGMGSVGGSLGASGGAGRLGGMGSVDSHGGFNAAGGSVNTKPVSKVATTSAAQAGGTAANSAEKTADKATSVTSAATATTAASPAAAAAKSPGTAAPSTATRSDSAGIAGSVNQTVDAGGQHASAGANGALDAQRSGGSPSATVTGAANASLN
jgi:hypothetical protein